MIAAGTATGFARRVAIVRSRYFRREQVIDFLKSMIWVVPLTLLIWIYAEQEQRTDQTVQVQLEIRSTNPNRIVRILSRGGDLVSFDVTGSKSRLEAAKTKLDQSGNKLNVEVDDTHPTGEQSLLLEPVVQRLPFFHDNNVELKSITPQSILVEIDELVDRDIEVRVSSDLHTLAAPPIFEPRTVRIRAPRSMLEAAERLQGGKLYAIADIQSNPELMRPGTHDATAVPLLPPPGVEGEYTKLPGSVTVSLIIKKADEQYSFALLPVRISVAKPNMGKVTVECADVVSNVTVTGPAEQIARIRDQKEICYATLLVDAADAVNRPLQKSLDYHLPEGVSVVPADRDRPFDYKLKPAGE